MPSIDKEALITKCSSLDVVLRTYQVTSPGVVFLSSVTCDSDSTLWDLDRSLSHLDHLCFETCHSPCCYFVVIVFLYYFVVFTV